MATQIRLLGPVGVSRDGVETPALTGRLAVMLAAVALGGGRQVGFAALESYLWPDSPPEHPRRALQNYATRLRQLVGHDAIESQRGGFALGLDPMAVDVFRFRSLAATPPEGTPPETELRRLRDALALWHGEPLFGLSPDALTREYGPRLVDEFLSATERANELRLQMGDVGTDLLTSLRQLIDENPWRERLWGQLMLALYHQGRQGEALTAYHDLVGVLREDLGITPGAELVRLHERILAGDTDLVGAGPINVSAPAKPAQLPPAIADFVGRSDELAALTSTVRPGDDRVRIALISGSAGVGKTTFAVHAANAVRASFPDGQLFADLGSGRTPVEPANVLGTFLRALGIPNGDVPASVEERTALLRSLCADRKLLFVLDDAAGIDQITPLLPGSPGCAVIITSRPRLAMAADVHIDLGMFNHDEARALMVKIIGRPRHEAEPEAADYVLRACGGAPLAVRIAASRLATRPSWPIEHMAARLAGADRLDELWLGDRSVQAMFDTIYASLDPELAERFLLLGAVPGAVIDLDLAAEVWATDMTSARWSLELLTDIRLLDFAAEPDTYRWHDLVRLYAAQHGDIDRSPAGRRILHYFIQSLLNAKRLVRPDDRPEDPIILATDDVVGRTFTDRADVHAWLHPRWPTLTDVAVRELTSDDKQRAAEAAGMTVLMDVVSSDCCDVIDAEVLMRAVTEAALPPEADRFVAAAWHNLYSTLYLQARYAEARPVGEIALERHRRRGDRYCEAAMLHNMAFQLAGEGKFAEARAYALAGCELGDALPDPIRARCLYGLATTEVELGDLEAARKHLDEADALDQPSPSSAAAYRRAIAWAAFRSRAEPATPLTDAFADVLAIADELGSSKLRCEAWVAIAHAAAARGEDGVEAAQSAVDLAREGHHLRLETLALKALADACERRGDGERASQARQQADALLS